MVGRCAHPSLVLAFVLGPLLALGACGTNVTGAVAGADGGPGVADTDPGADASLQRDSSSEPDVAQVDGPNEGASTALDASAGEDARDASPFDAGTDAGCTPPCTVIASNETAYTLAIDSANLYWADYDNAHGTSALRSWPLSGGSPGTVLPNPGFATGLAVGNAVLYYTGYDGSEVDSVPIAGGASSSSLATGQRPFGVAVNGTTAFWTNYGDGTIASVPLSGGNATPVSSSGGMPTQIALDGSSVYWLDGSVFKAPLGGGPGKPLSSYTGELAGIAIDSSFVYYTDQTLGNVNKVPVGGGTDVNLASSQYAPQGIAVDAANVYFCNNGSGEVMKVPLTGGNAVPLAVLSEPFALVLDDTYVYVTTVGDGTIVRIPK